MQKTKNLDDEAQALRLVGKVVVLAKKKNLDDEAQALRLVGKVIVLAKLHQLCLPLL